MSHASNARKLDRMAGTRGKKRNPWIEAACALDREYSAARIFGEVAQALAGIEKVPINKVAPSVDCMPKREPLVASVSPGNLNLTWSKTVRPGRDDILTWDEAMRVPWIEESIGAER